MTDQFQVGGIGLQQLWYTWSKEGLGGLVGFQIRAVSDDLKNVESPRVRSFHAYLNYDLPQGTDSYQATTANSPLCLIFADPDAGAPNYETDPPNTHILVRKIYTGQDGYGRSGAYFAHLIDLYPYLSAAFVASDAISLWNAAFWQERDDRPGSVRLDLLRSEALRPNETYRYPLAALQSLRREYLEYVIQAYLSLRPEQKLYIAAPAEDVALLIWCLAHSLPRSLQQKQNLTFTTYEQEVTQAATRVVGTCLPTVARQHASPPPLLPLENFSSSSGSALALDCYTGQRSPLPPDPDGELAEYAQSVVQQFLSGGKPLIDDMLKAASSAKVIDTRQLLTFFKGYKGALQGLTPRNASALLDNADMAASLLQQPAVQQSLINLCITDPGWWKTEGQPKINNLRRFDNPPGLKNAVAAFSMTATDVLAAKLVGNEADAASALLGLLDQTAPASEGNPAWLRLLVQLVELGARERHFSPRRAFDWNTRSWLLTQWACIKTQIDDEGQRRNQNLIFPWLKVKDWTEIHQMVELRGHLPTSWRVLAMSDAIIRFSKEGQQPDRKYLLYWMKNDGKLFESALGALMQRAETLPAAQWYFGLLVAVDYEGCFDLLLFLLQISSQVPNQNIEGFLAALEIARRKKGRQILLEQYGQVLLAHQITPSIVQIIDSYLGGLSKKFDTELAEAGTKQALRALYEQRARLPEPLPTRVQHWYFASTVIPLKGARTGAELQIPLETEQVKGIAAAIVHFRLQEHEEFKDSLYEVLIYSISSSGKLNEVISVLAPALSLEPMVLFRDLMDTQGETFNARQDDYHWLLPYLKLALQGASTQPPAKRDKYLDGLLPLLFEHVDKTRFDQIDASVHRRMDAPLVQLWESYRERVRPGSGLLKLIPRRIRPGKRQAVQQPATVNNQPQGVGSSAGQVTGFTATGSRNGLSDNATSQVPQSYGQPDAVPDWPMWNQSQQQPSKLILPSEEDTPPARRVDPGSGRPGYPQYGENFSSQEANIVFPAHAQPSFKPTDYSPSPQSTRGSDRQGGVAPNQNQPSPNQYAQGAGLPGSNPSYPPPSASPVQGWSGSVAPGQPPPSIPEAPWGNSPSQQSTMPVGGTVYPESPAPLQLESGPTWQGGPNSIDPQIYKMDTLKFLYKELRRPDLSNRITHLSKQKMNEQLERLKQRLNAEVTELDEMPMQSQSSESLSQTRRLLENDRIIQDALDRLPDWQRRYQQVIMEIRSITSMKGYKEAKQKYSATDKDVEAILTIFIHSRVMESYLRDIRSPQSLKDWLRGERQKRDYPPDMDSNAYRAW